MLQCVCDVALSVLHSNKMYGSIDDFAIQLFLLVSRNIPLQNIVNLNVCAFARRTESFQRNLMGCEIRILIFFTGTCAMHYENI